MKCTIIQQTLVCNAAENLICKSLDLLDIQYNSYSAIGFNFSRSLESSKEKEKFILEITLTFNMYVLLGEVMNFEISSHAFKLCLICMQVMHVISSYAFIIKGRSSSVL